MEHLGVFEGILAYEHEVTAGQPLIDVVLQLIGVHDRAYVLTDGNFVQVQYTVSLNTRASVSNSKRPSVVD